MAVCMQLAKNAGILSVLMPIAAKIALTAILTGDINFISVRMFKETRHFYLKSRID